MVARFAVGIDLGTTNTVVAYAAIDGGADARPATFLVPQLVAPGEVARRPLFPSLLYAPAEAEGLEDPFGDAPWALGEIGVRRGVEVPGRLVASSKSWLVHAGVDRTAAILPWGAPEETPKISPVEAAARLLAHVRDAWDADHPDAPLTEQEVALTVPASFDEVARELTVQAARRARLDPTLIEEPQAAFYDWMAAAGPGGLSRLVAAAGGAAFVLVVDVGGGTTDLSLVRVSGETEVVRMAVGPHLLVGGDNMDLALAHVAEPRIAGDGERLDPAPFAQLTAACHVAKEALLGEGGADEAPVAVALGRGAQLVGRSRATRIGRDEVERVVLEGFFPSVAADDRPRRSRGALVAFGLPYERDVAVTRHVAAFVSRHLPGRWPDAVLLNGGVFRSARLAKRVIETLSAWRGSAVLRLPDADPDRAVARGAVAHLRARRGRGVKIGGGSGRGYYVGVAADPPQVRAVCVVPRGADEGVVHSTPERTFALAVGTPVRFDVYASDEADAATGHVVEVDVDRFARLPSIATVVDVEGGSAASGAELRVSVEAELTPIGTLNLACVEAGAKEPRRFQLAFQLQEAVEEPRRGPPSRAPSAAPPRRLEAAVELLDLAFGKARSDVGTRTAKDLLRSLERALGPRGQWSAATSRALFDALLSHAGARRRSTDHERVFWLLAGWCIRPGFGDPRDPNRVAAMFALFDEKLAFPSNPRDWQHFFIAWRRAAGGLDEAAQTRIRDYVDPFLDTSGAARRPRKAPLAPEDALDMASSLERVEERRRAQLGGWVLERTWTDRDPRLWAALGRLGARVPAYGSVHYVVPPRVAEQWLDHLLREKWSEVPSAVEAAVQLARQTGDRARDVNERTRAEVERRLVAAGAALEAVRAVREVVAMRDAERASVFGDELPPGLRLLD